MCYMSSLLVSRAALADLVLCTGLAGCSGSERPQSSGVEVHGLLRMSGGPRGAPQPGVAGRITFVDTADGGQTTEVPTQNDGTFTAKLSPGTYAVTGRSPSYGDNQGICRTDDKVVVQGGGGPIAVACSRR